MSNGQCDPCGTRDSKKWFLVGIGLTIGFFLFLMIATRIRSRANNKSLHSSIKRICITHIQLLSYIMALNVPWPFFIVFVFYFVTAVVSNSAPMAATECLMQQEGEFAGVAINQLQFMSVEINNFFAVSLIVLVLAPFLIVIPLNIVWWIVLSPFSRIFSCGRPLRTAVCGCGGKQKRRVVKNKKEEQDNDNENESKNNKKNKKNKRKSRDDNKEQHDDKIEYEYGEDSCTLCCRWFCNCCRCCPKCCVRRCEKKKGSLEDNTEYRPSTFDACVASSVLVMYLVLPSIWRICFTALQSYKIGDQTFAAVNLEQKWFQGDHFLLCVYAAFPALLVR